ncbi:hypothetical protein D4764_10G0010760 [Takifugu flavidus]|uniref:Uncharacterized protein n=1 Tax=Takifugu flavidus TaxID=433684 RepID=A0A5C6PM85_9TELE|nr:hypothetical protein D4764_10G0010760 [Takifugu flavidus]
MKDEVEEGLDAIFSGSPPKPPNFCSLGAMILILNNVIRKFAKRVKKFFKPRKVKQRKESPVDTTENGVGDGGPHSSLSKELKEIITPIVDIVPEEDYEGVFTETATEIQALSEDIAPILTGKKEKKNPLRLRKEKIANLFSKCFLNVWIRHLISQLRKQHPMLRRGDSSESVRSLVVTVTSLVDNDTSLVNGFQEMTSSHKSVFQETTTRLFRHLEGIKVDSESGDAALEFLKLLLRGCQHEFLKDINDDEAFMSKQKELDAAQNQDEHQRLESELLPTCGKQLDTEEAKPRMDQYFSYIDYIIQEVCESVISVCGVSKVNCPQMLGRSGLLKTFLTDQHKQLEALDALQELTDTIEHSHNLMWIFLDIL